MVRLIVAAAAVVTGCCLPAASIGARESDAILRWRGHTAMMTIEIVRGAVRVVREPRTDVVLEASGSGAPISFEMIRSGNGWLLRDVHADRPVWFAWRECLPPSGVHGDPYGSNARASVTMRVPNATLVEARILQEDATGH